MLAIIKNWFHVLLILIWGVIQFCSNVIGPEAVVVSMYVSWSSFPEVVLVYDWISGTFLSMLGVVGGMVFIYSYKYIHGVIGESKFYLVVGVFCVSMVVLSLSGDVFWAIVGWDGLGFTSFCMIIFFHSWKSMGGGLVTFLCNRFGDLFMMSSIVCMLSMGMSMGIFSEFGIMLSVFIMIGCMTKSAQVPFSAWLPQAMAAPTPVSSLVHSSTLVTAGVFIMSRFYWAFDDNIVNWLYFISGITILVAGSSSLVEWDLNKVIALSTRTHVGLMLNIVSLGSIESGLLHIQIHAYFKSLLFIGAGVVIYDSRDGQDLRQASCNCGNSEWIIVMVSTISIVGVPFMAGFQSKEVLIMTLGGSNSLVVVPFWVGVTLTVSYCVRILVHIVWNSSVVMSSRGGLFCSASILLGGLSVFGCIGLGTYGLEYLVVVWFESWLKGVLVVVMVLGIVLGCFSVIGIGSFGSGSLLEFFWKCEAFVYFGVVGWCKNGWNLLYVCDCKGSLDANLVYLGNKILSGLVLLEFSLSKWVMFTLKIFFFIAVFGVFLAI